MSVRSATRSSKMNVNPTSSDTTFGAGDVVLEDKVMQLEETLKKFRAEVDMKMSIMEQVLTTRNETFAAHKKLIEREEALHETVLSHWKNIPVLAATGLTLKFTENGTREVEVQVQYGDTGEGDTSNLGKRSATSARRDRRKRLRTKLKAESDSEGVSGDDAEDDPLATDNFDEGAGSDGDKNNENEPNLERKVFVNYYSDEPATPGQRVTRTPVWKYYLREEKGEAALCKMCDDAGVQTILKVRKGCGTSSLHNHLKSKHAIDLHPPREKELGNEESEKSTDQKIATFSSDFQNQDDEEKESSTFRRMDLERLIANGSDRVSFIPHEPAQKGRRPSEAWNQFQHIAVDEKMVNFVACKNCMSMYSYSSKEGCSTLLKHTQKCSKSTEQKVKARSNPAVDCL